VAVPSSEPPHAEMIAIEAIPNAMTFLEILIYPISFRCCVIEKHFLVSRVFVLSLRLPGSP
jgi:hypothetical protein